MLSVAAPAAATAAVAAKEARQAEGTPRGRRRFVARRRRRADGERAVDGRHHVGPHDRRRRQRLVVRGSRSRPRRCRL